MEKALVILYRTNNVCQSETMAFNKGEYVFNTNMWKPALIRIESITTITIYFGSDDNKKVYNNPYPDRYVVVKLDQELLEHTITKIVVSVFTPSVECIRSSNNELCFLSSTDVIVILILVCTFILFKQFVFPEKEKPRLINF